MARHISLRARLFRIRISDFTNRKRIRISEKLPKQSIDFRYEIFNDREMIVSCNNDSRPTVINIIDFYL
jgi:hypothetical protein